MSSSTTSYRNPPIRVRRAYQEHEVGRRWYANIELDVHLLHAICTTAAGTQDPPFKALFAAYDFIFADEGVEHEHDGVVFRYLMRLGEQARSSIRAGTWQGYAHALRDLLRAYEITLVDGTEDGLGEEVKEPSTRAKQVHAQSNGCLNTKLQRRRVSFNDSRLDETWLSEQSRSLNASPAPSPNHLAQPPKRGPEATHDRRSRSTEGRRSSVRFAEPEVEPALAPAPLPYRSAHQRAGVPESTLQPSHDELEARAEAFYGTCDYRITRHYLHRWIDATLLTQERFTDAYEQAAQYDRHILLNNAFMTLIEHARFIWQQRREAVLHEQWEADAQRVYDARLLPKAFTHWLNAARRGHYDTRKAQQWIMQLKYFRRWKQLTLENAVKARSLLSRRLFRRWKGKAAHQETERNQKAAVYEEWLTKRYFRKMIFSWAQTKIVPWRILKAKENALGVWRGRLKTLRANDGKAEDRVERTGVSNALHKLRNTLIEHQRLRAAGERHHASKLKTKYLTMLSAQARLTPVASVVSLKCRLDLERRAFGAWSLQLRLSKEAVDVNKRRILQAAWTKWNDALRCRALSQRNNERVVLEVLYRWVLQERLKLFTRTRESRLAQRAFIYLRNHIHKLWWRLDQAFFRYQQGEQRRILSTGMVRLNSAIRRQEDAERAAVEFANLRRLPGVLEVWRGKADHAVRLAQKATRARYYLLGVKTLRLWNEKTTEHKHKRRRGAYTHVRTRLKVRVARESLAKWRDRTARVRSLDETATRLTHERFLVLKTNTLTTWRNKVAHTYQLHKQATLLDQGKLLSGALNTMLASYITVVALEARSRSFLQYTEFMVQATALRRLQWAAFTASRRAESAEALRLRNRDLHVREWLRLWSSKAAVKRQPPPTTGAEEPESPSLRPASRAAARSASRDRFTSPARLRRDEEVDSTTPAYTRTPSRSRRASRFRSLQTLPTPAAVTPMAFDSAYLSTTPAPLQSAVQQPQPSQWQARPASPAEMILEGLTPQITPFARKLRAGGVGSAATATPGVVPPSALKRSVFGRSGVGTAKNVRFAGGSRFQRASPREVAVGEGEEGYLKSS